MSEQTIGTTCVQGGYHPGDAEPRQVPIYQSTTWKYDTSEHMGKLFDLEESGYFYSRLQNPRPKSWRAIARYRCFARRVRADKASTRRTRRCA